MTAYAGNDFLLYIEDSGSPGTYILVGGGKSCSVSFDGAPAVSTDNIGQNAAAVIPSTMVCGCTVSGSGIFSNSEGEAQLLTAAFSVDTANFKIVFARSKQIIGAFYVTSFSRSGDLGAAEAYSFSLQGDNIIASSISGEEASIAWSTTRKITGMTLSNSNKTVAGAGVGMCLADTARSSGKRYCEIDMVWVPNAPSIGVILDSYAGAYISTWPGNQVEGWGVWLDGYGLIHNGSYTGAGTSPDLRGVGPATVYSRMGIAVDFTAGKLWFRYPNGSFGVNYTGNPATGANADFTDAALINAAILPVFGGYTVPCSATLYCKSSEFSLGTLPSGFTSWAEI